MSHPQENENCKTNSRILLRANDLLILDAVQDRGLTCVLTQDHHCNPNSGDLICRTLVERTQPQPGANEVVVEFHVASLNETGRAIFPDP
jgi:hypothetical protein